VEYVLADKTGTLTQNIMAFVNCSIGGVAYGKKPRTVGSETVASASRSVHLVAQDDVLKGNFTANSDTGRLCCQFFTHLALCHNVYPRLVDELPVKYQAASPDDAALVQEISRSFKLWSSFLSA
jgi:magnesium-transporting ATPase (P-type)